MDLFLSCLCPKPTIDPSHQLGEADESHLTAALEAIVERSSSNFDAGDGLYTPLHVLQTTSWFNKLIPGLEKLLNDIHAGNFVVVRDTGEQIFEYMPIYARVGMHLLFYGYGRSKLLSTPAIEKLLRDQSFKQGRIYDSATSAKSIPSFVQTYSLATNELLQPDITKYKSFNEFFSRKLKPGARPVADAANPLGICSAADCRLTVYASIDQSTHFWIKGYKFTVPNLLNVAPDSPQAAAFAGASLAIFRLAPADYHRFHSPVDCTVGEINDFPGQYYTVNPEVVNEPGFDVFTANRRAVLYLTHTPTRSAVAVVAVGALLVGSIGWTGGAQKGAQLRRGDELGFFAYGGSTVIVLFFPGVGVQYVPYSHYARDIRLTGLPRFDDDLVKNSDKPIETLVKVGYSIGKSVPK
ncbi:hypothetical protein H0H81_007013 [Sphagnurus paluster]|uniref:phosphatidylserine decarboxylase n=1 Tax=Sphagnurus paluster TaxID=117069 RepID=A0A9P7FVF5_9AGAR|nr:hypothetical protein H0H81_007013 [Sphagnurus paluster]